MQRFSVLPEILGTMHQLSHLFQDGHRSSIDLCPGPSETTYWSCTECRDNRGQGGKIVHRAAFLCTLVNAVMLHNGLCLRLQRIRNV